MLFIVGTGPGSLEQMTGRAKEAIACSTHVVGNGMYLDMLEGLVTGKTVITSSMGREVDRARKAVELSRKNVVTIVSGGDAGVYGMASIVLEIVERTGVEVDVEIVPGVTAATAAAARLGSPLSSDFMVISLSDLLTPWVEIERRLEAAFSLGIPVVLYNPKSVRRPMNLAKAMGIASKHIPLGTPIGVVKDAYREGERVVVTTLGEVIENDAFVDMHSTVVVGGKDSRMWKVGSDVKGIITPRGYDRKYVY
jgi:precorrin-3B C17-methyltransferase